MSRSRSTGKLGLRFALGAFLLTAVAAGLVGVMMIRSLEGQVPEEEAEVVGKAWRFAGVLVLLVAGVGGVLGFLQGSALGSRLTDLGLAVAKLGRGAGDVRVRLRGNDEATALGRAIQHLASDFAGLVAEAGGRGNPGAEDDLLREFRDRALPEEPPQLRSFEVDGRLVPGSSAGGDYYGWVASEDETAVLFAVSAEGAGPLALWAARMARDELARALGQGVGAKKALGHCNRVLHRNLPQGVCATASLIELLGDEATLFQAGYRAPLWICAAGELREVHGEGLALGLDSGPVFDRGLEGARVPLRPGVRLVQTNAAGDAGSALADAVRQHSPKHSAPFMSLVEDALEDGAAPEVLLLTAKRV